METREALIPVAGDGLPADLVIPDDPVGVVLFAHGSGSSRHSPRNTAVARTLHERALATVLVDLLTEEEDRVDARTAELRFDIPMLGDRLSAIIDWMCGASEVAPLPVGLFGASTGAAAALVAAAARPDRVGAVVSRGGRPDLAGAALPRVKAPTLLLVGGLDEQVITLNEQAMTQLSDAAELRIIAGATHLFEEPGTLERVAADAAAWFALHLPR
ncbi:dienelactone hydrolase family protein [Micromonospora sp. PLK6-60]|uniref:dienelactone hydrolase family protein n=1 Tax=Micromonospora sp. PLK6-60 TaxID=2873383 RepID=UPI001CA72EA0|nr:alpha/beta family hydrolase [Micromonospora sp. PLK6-60]MBY8871739.1 dienelactone hydrolase family protein [Micromonospora sp. PLK6-60]